MTRLRLGRMLVIVVLAFLPTPRQPQSRAQGTAPGYRDGFEGARPAWQATAADAPYRLTVHARTAGARTGHLCEHLQLVSGTGSYVYFGYQIPPARVIAELVPAVHIRGDRAGVQLLARVVLPQSKDPRTGLPVSALVQGSSYTQTGVWQRLQLENVPQLVERQVRVLRATYGPSIDARGAYVDRILLNVYCGPGASRVWIDDVEVRGLVPVAPSSSAPGQTPASSDRWSDRQPSTAITRVSASTVSAPEVRLAGSLLTANERPLVPRIIQHNGEPLAYLKQLGFNCVWLPGVPRSEILEEAARLGLWLIAPPPSAQQLESQLRASPGFRIDGSYDWVLAWDLGSRLSGRDLESIRNWTKLLRKVDPRSRPLLCNAEASLKAFSREVDVLAACRLPLGTSAELSEFITWLRERPQLARPGTPFWAWVQTEPSRELLEQTAILAPSSAGLQLQSEQVRQLALATIAAGMRGISFRSESSLENGQPPARRRAAMLRLLNMELELIEPWAVSGNFVTAASANDTAVLAAVVQAERSRLVLPICAAPSSQFVLGQSSGPMSLLVPGVPEANKAFALSTTSLRPLAARRATGGIRVTLDEQDRDALVLLTGDDHVIRGMSQKIEAIKAEALALQRQLAEYDLRVVQDVEKALAAQGRVLEPARSLLTAARSDLASAAGPGPSAAEDAAGRVSGAARKIRQVARAHWERTQAASHTESNPLKAGFETLPHYWRLQTLLPGGRPSADVLGSGNFEDLSATLRAGWQHFEHVEQNIATSVELSPVNPHSGTLSLRLKAAAADPKTAPSLIETPPLWVTSSQVACRQGQLVEMQAWINVPKPLAGSSDGLLVLDSQGGELLAERIRQTKGWTKLVVYRAAKGSLPFSVTFALSGLGEAWIDDVEVRLVDLAGLDASARRPLR